MTALVATVISIVSPYMVKGAEEFAKSAGAAAFNAAKALVDRLRTWWNNEPVAEAAAKALPSDPERYAKVLAEALDHDLTKDPAFAAELKKLVDAAGPYAEVYQKMDVARGVTGAEIGSLLSGHLSVQQEVRDAQNVTGLKVDKIGT
jgi:hypothetical protein